MSSLFYLDAIGTSKSRRARGKLGVATTPKTGFKCGFSSAAMPESRLRESVSDTNCVTAERAYSTAVPEPRQRHCSSRDCRTTP
ncbi:hypothetical protein MJO28_017265 [Puccinia striiformis f. sp. tritici]|uniref:hypothetical protein n=1 Tax=Puccinia striiformis f. sp. tritici TaxID=168172 RepID=UPI002007FB7D|nr:hypothetical protein Pst134EA_013623 [Puccinia striiformis f. sp. tritici]KAH9465755.1 hypothetical protein Pst134EA_013623 [Puccinia striiformis f. sp. tritici]KAI7934166.1 hypothetical protein MJO28_017265 [Puccinia striiformis f. sp. tritici]KAI7956058.1 hypothetical protein MJO29_007457 [Puccinia striiformis f. sp. tritici]KAI9612439.1 hypothetical protein KEM48_004172 [Puccinia striiformis f. sp. tritici PST-130]